MKIHLLGVGLEEPPPVTKKLGLLITTRGEESRFPNSQSSERQEANFTRTVQNWRHVADWNRFRGVTQNSRSSEKRIRAKYENKSETEDPYSQRKSKKLSSWKQVEKKKTGRRSWREDYGKRRDRSPAGRPAEPESRG